jgi:hypothetical protein
MLTSICFTVSFSGSQGVPLPVFLAPPAESDEMASSFSAGVFIYRIFLLKSIFLIKQTIIIDSIVKSRIASEIGADHPTIWDVIIICAEHFFHERRADSTAV